jgi:hypothetical protein
LVKILPCDKPVEENVLTAGMIAAKAPHIGSGLCVSEL